MPLNISMIERLPLQGKIMGKFSSEFLQKLSDQIF